MPARFLQCLTTILIAGTLIASTQEPMKPPHNSRIMTATKQVTLFGGLEQQMLMAVKKKDKTALTAMLTDDFAIEMPGADRLAGEDWVDSVMDKEFILKSFVLRDVSVTDWGDTAAVNYSRTQQATFKGRNEGGVFFVVDVWRKAGDSWKLAGRYVTKVGSISPNEKIAPKPTGKE